MTNARRAAISVLGLFVALIVSGCGLLWEHYPRPETTSTAPPMPAGTVPIGHVTWRRIEIAVPPSADGVISAAAAGLAGYVVVGSEGLPPKSAGVVLASADARDWQRIDDPEARAWSLGQVVATSSGFVAFGQRDSDTFSGSPILTGILTSADGRTWRHRATFAGLPVDNVAARGSVVVAIARPIPETLDPLPSRLLVSKDAGTTWQELSAASAGFGDGWPIAVAVMGDAGWVAVGQSRKSAAAWWSTDGIAWTRATMEGAGPTETVVEVRTYGVAAGDHVAVARGTDETACPTTTNVLCGTEAGWATLDGRDWQRLPRTTPVGTSSGAMLCSAGAAGVLAQHARSLTQSGNGWQWDPVDGTGNVIPPFPLLVHDRTIVAMDVGTSGGPAFWVGTFGD